MQQPKFTLIRRATVLSMDPGIGNLTDCDILIENDKIQAVAPNLTVPNNAPATIIDGSDCIVTPGFVDGHHHIWQHLLRGVATDWTLLDYCIRMRTVYGSLFTPEDVYLAQYVGALSLLSNGVTCVLDHCHVVNSPAHADAAVKGLRDARIRGTFCYGLYENPPLSGQKVSPFDLNMRKQDAARVCHEVLPNRNPDEALVTFGFAPREPEGQPVGETVADIKLARDLGARITTMHVAMGHYDTRHTRVAQCLADADLLGPDLVFSHGASFTDGELAAIAGSRAGIVGTPDTELQMGMGRPVVFKARDAGCRTCLGLDITSNQGNDFVAQMRLALQTQRAVENQNRDFSPPATLERKTEDVLRMGTMGGAEVMHLESLVGSITPGKKADLVLFRCDDIDTVPVLDPVATVVFHTSPANIDTVFVDGKIVKRDGRLVGVDWAALRRQVKERSRQIVQEAAKVDTAVQREQWSRAFGVA